MTFRALCPLALVLSTLTACQSGGSGEKPVEDVLSVQPMGAPQQFTYTSPSQINYNPFTVDIWSQPSASGGAPRSYVRVAAPKIRIGSPQHEAVARAVVVEVANERVCQPGTQPQFQQQYGHDVYLNERVEKWSAIITCEAGGFAPMAPQGGGYGQGDGIAPLSNMASEYGNGPAVQQAPGVFSGGPTPPGAISANIY